MISGVCGSSSKDYKVLNQNSTLYLVLEVGVEPLVLRVDVVGRQLTLIIQFMGLDTQLEVVSLLNELIVEVTLQGSRCDLQSHQLHHIQIECDS